MKKLFTRGLLGVGALAVPAGALMAFPMAASAAPAPATHVDDCTLATGAAVKYTQYPNGCSFAFIDGNGQPFNYTNYVYKDVVTPSGNETEVFIGNAANALVPNNTGSVVTYNSTNMPNQTALSFVSGHTTSNWTLTIQPDGEWNLTANFSK
jgi:hypothetical protein